MAFNVKKNKRLPSQEPETPEPETEEAVDTASHSVATQSWVKKVMSKFWKWTDFFGTKSLRVADDLSAGRIQTNEIQTKDAYATRLTLLDPNGNPAAVYINEKGELKIDYDFKNVYIYPGDVTISNFVYRYGTDPQRIAANFVGLTPVELMLNFISYQSNVSNELNGKVCPMLCPADGESTRIDKTLLFQCSMSKKITGIEVWDSDEQVIQGKSIELPTGKTYRKLTVNMPSFGQDGQTEAEHVILPGDIISLGAGSLRPFMPPFLMPPPCPLFLQTANGTAPEFPLPPSLNNDIFSDEAPADDGVFDDIGNGTTDNQPMQVPSAYEVVYENYDGDTYYNIDLSRDFFDKNVEQYLVVRTAEA